MNRYWTLNTTFYRKHGAYVMCCTDFYEDNGYCFYCGSYNKEAALLGASRSLMHLLYRLGFKI